ncbi:tRNA pseudouridine(38-40) synthase TruA [Kytococcus schroeteri]|uniref:tRNA pseudouridine synthase A n=1 Tax=Kytococcus schroeteri TaxID=138300 RepID=A0A2I1PCL6_9MICO|nr:tRNA pseudouridine(38-40) synthase TruA [Kytococcus schroeteri]PKZ42344.1 tRNA pseudouridine(38-40) synthase TruA [Kytococcus schroeteri]
MPRLRLDFAYDGRDFHGWAAQPGLRTVEQELQEALCMVLRADSLALTVAGRTDAGVHATGSVCHVDVDQAAWDAVPGRSDRTPEEALVVRLAGVLPVDLVVHRVQGVGADFDARFSALRRHYRYLLWDRTEHVDPRLRGLVVRHRRELDVEAMDAAARRLEGLNDFAAFCKRREGATTVRTLEHFAWSRRTDGVIEGTVVADAFCHSMVRALVGGVVPVGEGRREVGWPREVLEGRERIGAVTVMPAHGLTLEQVDYPPADQWAARQAEARSTRDALA